MRSAAADLEFAAVAELLDEALATLGAAAAWTDVLVPVLQELGLPIITPEYWVEGFDPASLAG